eukprot:COSAG06_NODE_6772_length_2788_cov_1.781703_3_plen_69_part_00
MSTQIREIVDLLNKPPFSKNFSLCAPCARLRPSLLPQLRAARIREVTRGRIVITTLAAAPPCVCARAV